MEAWLKATEYRSGVMRHILLGEDWNKVRSTRCNEHFKIVKKDKFIEQVVQRS